MKNSRKRKQDREQELNRIWLLILPLLVFLLPAFSGPYVIYVSNLAGIAIIVCLGLNILTGLTGQISIGHAAFLAVGAYSSCILTTKLGMPFPVALICSGVIAAGVGCLVAIPCMRLKHLYLAIATMGFAFIINEIILYWRALTNGADGMFAPHASLGPFVCDSDMKMYYLIYVVVLLLLYFAYNISCSRTGRAMLSVKESEEAAQASGVNPAKYKFLAFAISAFYAGVAGSLFAHTIKVISPESFTFLHSIQYLVMVIVGGLGSVWGAVLGAIFITWLPESIRHLHSVFPGTALMSQDIQLFIYGFIMVVFMIFEPSGLYGRWLKTKTYWKLFPLSPRKLKGENMLRRWR